MRQADVVPLRKTGRCASGAELDGGTLYHAVPMGSNPWSRALCGTAPGKRGNGWSQYPGEKVTCVKCLLKTQEKSN
jgi:hypothetical protein